MRIHLYSGNVSIVDLQNGKGRVSAHAENILRALQQWLRLFPRSDLNLAYNEEMMWHYFVRHDFGIFIETLKTISDNYRADPTAPLSVVSDLGFLDQYMAQGVTDEREFFSIMNYLSKLTLPINRELSENAFKTFINDERALRRFVKRVGSDFVFTGSEPSTNNTRLSVQTRSALLHAQGVISDILGDTVPSVPRFKFSTGSVNEKVGLSPVSKEMALDLEWLRALPEPFDDLINQTALGYYRDRAIRLGMDLENVVIDADFLGVLHSLVDIHEEGMLHGSVVLLGNDDILAIVDYEVSSGSVKRVNSSKIDLKVRHTGEAADDVIEYDGQLKSLPARVGVVEKDASSVRLITIETATKISVQLSVLELITESAKKSPLCGTIAPFWDQNIHRKRFTEELATLATTDMKRASDRLPFFIVEFLFAKTWLAPMLKFIRTEAVLLNDEEIRLSKFGGMGNGDTFPVQCLCYAALAHFFHGDGVSVFGDDLITVGNPTTLHQTLEEVGLIINIRKSYNVESSFKESCGLWFSNGKLVTPLRYSRKPRSRLANWSATDTMRNLDLHNRCYVQFPALAALLLSEIEERTKSGDPKPIYAMNERAYNTRIATDDVSEVFRNLSLRFSGKVLTKAESIKEFRGLQRRFIEMSPSEREKMTDFGSNYQSLEFRDTAFKPNTDIPFSRDLLGGEFIGINLMRLYYLNLRKPDIARLLSHDLPVLEMRTNQRAILDELLVANYNLPVLDGELSPSGKLDSLARTERAKAMFDIGEMIDLEQYMLITQRDLERNIEEVFDVPNIRRREAAPKPGAIHEVPNSFLVNSLRLLALDANRGLDEVTSFDIDLLGSNQDKPVSISAVWRSTRVNPPLDEDILLRYLVGKSPSLTESAMFSQRGLPEKTIENFTNEMVRMWVLRSAMDEEWFREQKQGLFELP